jgi:hypothetical protein
MRILLPVAELKPAEKQLASVLSKHLRFVSRKNRKKQTTTPRFYLY